jgi:hypothetical protein
VGSTFKRLVTSYCFSCKSEVDRLLAAVLYGSCEILYGTRYYWLAVRGNGHLAQKDLQRGRGTAVATGDRLAGRGSHDPANRGAHQLDRCRDGRVMKAALRLTYGLRQIFGPAREARGPRLLSLCVGLQEISNDNDQSN